MTLYPARLSLVSKASCRYFVNFLSRFFAIFCCCGQAKIIPRLLPVYRLQDYADDEIEGVFYEEELQKVHKSDDVYKIEKILAEKKENSKVKVLVKWLGHDKKLDSWIPKSEL